MKKRFIIFVVVAVFLAGAFVFLGGSTEASSKGDAWKVRCQEIADKGEYCEMYHRLTVQDTGQTFSDFAIGYPEGPDGVAKGRLLLPLGILLSEGVQMQVDGASAAAFPVRYCDQKGCHVFLSFDESVIKVMRGGQKMVLSFASSTGQRLTFPVSLSGFTRAFKKIVKN